MIEPVRSVEPVRAVKLGFRKLVPSEALVAADGMVRSHEHAHMAVLGAYASSPISYTYVTLPDGSTYAVGGSIKVDLAPVPGDPEATIRKARAIMRAAQAVRSPSPADQRVAARAYQMEMQAQRELEEERKAGKDPFVMQGVLV